jgi:hypothetical protein
MPIPVTGVTIERSASLRGWKVRAKLALAKVSD